MAAELTAIETFFRVVLFNYLFSNGDSHLKNFSLIETDRKDYGFSKAYDLMSTVLHTPGEIPTALELCKEDMEDEFFGKTVIEGEELYAVRRYR